MKFILGNKDRSGLTLIEIVFAIFILGLLGAAVIISLTRAFYIMEDSRDFANAYKIIQNEIETIRCSDWSTVGFLTDSYDQTVAGVDEKFKLTTEISTNTGGDQKTIKYTVKWTNAKGRSLSEIVKITYTKDGISG